MKAKLVPFSDAMYAYSRGKTIFYMFKGRKTYVDADTMLHAGLILHAHWFIEKEKITVDRIKTVCYSVIVSLKQLFRRKQL